MSAVCYSAFACCVLRLAIVAVVAIRVWCVVVVGGSGVCSYCGVLV